MFKNDVFDVTLYDREGNETYHTSIATFDKMTDWLADRVLMDRKASRAVIRDQHNGVGEVSLDELWDRLVVEGYIC